MPRPVLRLCLDDTSGHPALDTAVSRAVLERVDARELPATLRLSRPARVVAFSARDTRSPGFATAARSVADHGFDAVVRLAGGRAAVFTPGTIAFAWATPAEEPAAHITDRFAVLAGALRDAFTVLGADAHVGEVPGEYCAGEWSVNVDRRRKVAGVGQRLLRRSAHTGGVVVVQDAHAINAVLTPVYDAMGVRWDPAATGQLVDEVVADADRSGDVWTAVRDAIVAAFAARFELEPWSLDPETLGRAERLVEDHLPHV